MVGRLLPYEGVLAMTTTSRPKSCEKNDVFILYHRDFVNPFSAAYRFINLLKLNMQ